MNKESHPLAGKTVVIARGDLKGKIFRVEDYWDKLTGRSWGESQGNPACIIYAMRTGLQKFEVPSDDEVLYGKIGSLGHLVHVNEIGEITKEKE